MKLIQIIIYLLFPLFAFTQNGTKQPYKSYNNVLDFEIIGDYVWAATHNGITQWNKNTLELVGIFNPSNSPLEGTLREIIEGADGRIHFLESYNYDLYKFLAFDGCEWELIKNIPCAAADFIVDEFGQFRHQGTCNEESEAFNNLNIHSMKASPNGEIYALERFNTVHLIPCNNNYTKYIPRLRKWNFDHWETIVEGSNDSTTIGSHLVFHPDGSLWIEPNKQVVDNQIVVHQNGNANAADFAFDTTGMLWTVNEGKIEIDAANNIFKSTEKEGLFKWANNDWQPLIASGMRFDEAENIFFDSLGNTWMQAGGLNQINNGIFTLHNTENSIVPNELISWHFVDKFQKTWFVFEGNQIDEARLLQFDNDTWVDFSTDVFLSYDFKDIQKDSADNIWFFYENTDVAVACRYDYSTFENFTNLDSFDLGNTTIPAVVWAMDSTTVLKIENEDTTTFEFPFPDIYTDLLFTEINQSGNAWIGYETPIGYYRVFWFDGVTWQPNFYNSGYKHTPNKIIHQNDKIWIFNSMLPHYENQRPSVLIIDKGVEKSILIPGCDDEYPEDPNAGFQKVELNEKTGEVAMIYNYWSHHENGPWCAPIVQCNLRIFTILNANGNGFHDTFTRATSLESKITDFKFDANGEVWYWGKETPILTTATILPYPIIFTQSSGCQEGRTVACVPQGTRENFSYLWSNDSTNPVQKINNSTDFDLTISTLNDLVFDTSFTVSGTPNLSISETLNLPSDDTANDGNILLNITGGMPPYTILWEDGSTDFSLNNLSAGIYQVIVEDAAGCQKELIFSLTLPLEINLQVADLQCFEYDNGAVSLSINGGMPPYQILFSTGDTLTNIENLSSGTYQVKVEDAGIFSEILNFEINEPEQLETTLNVTPETCENAQNGEIEIIPNEGTPPYQILWNNGATSFKIENLAAGDYSYTLTDINGCSFSETIPVFIESTLTATATISYPNFGENNGAITIFPQGGSPDYAVVWNNGMTTNEITNLSADIYTVLILDNNNCTHVEQFNLVNELEIEYAIDPISCLGNDDGAIHILPKGGFPPYEIKWLGTNITDTVRSDLEAGNYLVQVKDSGPFTKVKQISLSDGPMLTVDIDATSSGIGETNISIFSFPIDGIAPYEYLWNTGATTPNLINVERTNYAITVTDSQGCTGTERIYFGIFDDFSEESSITKGNFNKTASAAISKKTASKLADTEISIYPNPFEESFFIDFKNNKTAIANLEIYNILGQKMAIDFDSNLEKRILKIGTKEWSSGAYFIHYQVNDEMFVRKIIKQ